MLSENHIKEGNAIIAEYCGLKRIKPSETNSVEWWEKQSNSIEIPHIEYRCFMPRLYFHKSWDWLMSVIDKIQKEEVYGNPINFIIGSSSIIIYDDDYEFYDIEYFYTNDKLLKTWECVVEYLKKLNITKKEV